MNPVSEELRSGGARVAELAANLAAVRNRIALACERASRGPGEVALVAVSKTFPVTDVQTLLDLGHRVFGENRHQEAAVKAAAVQGARWHFLGQLQRNKAKAVAGYADVVESLDRAALIGPLTAGAGDRVAPLAVLIQVSLDEDRRRGGAQPAEVLKLAAEVAGHRGLALRGVMAVAPQDGAPRAAFARLREIADGVRREHPSATEISAGMSADLEDAVAEGATLVRVGAALFGNRPTVLG